MKLLTRFRAEEPKKAAGEKNHAGNSKIARRCDEGDGEGHAARCNPQTPHPSPPLMGGRKKNPQSGFFDSDSLARIHASTIRPSLACQPCRRRHLGRLRTIASPSG